MAGTFGILDVSKTLNYIIYNITILDAEKHRRELDAQYAYEQQTWTDVPCCDLFLQPF